MAVMEWTDGFKVGIKFMDADHQEAIGLMNALAEARGSARLDLLDRFIDHCAAHFAREETLMATIGFFALAPHSSEHRRVLAELRDIRAKLAAGAETGLAGYFTDALPAWLRAHRDTMDLMTAQFALQRGDGDIG